MVINERKQKIRMERSERNALRRKNGLWYCLKRAICTFHSFKATRKNENPAVKIPAKTAAVSVIAAAALMGACPASGMIMSVQAADTQAQAWTQTPENSA